MLFIIFAIMQFFEISIQLWVWWDNLKKMKLFITAGFLASVVFETIRTGRNFMKWISWNKILPAAWNCNLLCNWIQIKTILKFNAGDVIKKTIMFRNNSAIIIRISFCSYCALKIMISNNSGSISKLKIHNSPMIISTKTVFYI